MELVEWDESFSVGNALLDAHHRIFIEMIKEFREREKNDRDAIKERIEFLIEYTAMHLGAEEKLMFQANYPGFGDHKAVHDAFTKQLLSIKKTFDADPTSVTAEEILKIMQDWLINHIADSDKRYMPYIRKLQDESK